MKKGFIAVMILLCMVPVACKKKAKSNFGYSVKPVKGLDTLISAGAKINGQAWQTDSVIAYISKSPGDSTKINLMVTATLKQNSSASTISFNVNNYTGINTYTVDPPYVSATYYLGNYRHYSGTGQVVISSDDSFGITGTFNFIADSTTVSEGKFNAAHP
jgi:hypothetical protein